MSEKPWLKPGLTRPRLNLVCTSSTAWLSNLKCKWPRNRYSAALVSNINWEEIMPGKKAHENFNQEEELLEYVKEHPARAKFTRGYRGHVPQTPLLKAPPKKEIYWENWKKSGMKKNKLQKKEHLVRAEFTRGYRWHVPQAPLLWAPYTQKKRRKILGKFRKKNVR